MGKHITFHNHDVFEGLADALPRATVKDTQPSHTGNSPVDDLTTSSSVSESEVKEDAQLGPAWMPPADPTISPTMSEVEDTQPGLMGTPPADDPTILSAIPEAEIREDLSSAQSTSPAKSGEDLVALTTAWADQLGNPPTPASSMGNEGKEYPKWDKGVLLPQGSHCGKYPL